MFRLASRTAAAPARAAGKTRSFATVSPVTGATRSHKVVVVGGGTGGICASHQLLRSGRFAQDDIAVVDPASHHHYQPGWTLVGGGLKTAEELEKPMKELVDPKFKFYNNGVKSLNPEENSVTLESGDKVSYEHLILAPGIKIEYASIKGLAEALADKSSLVSTIYGRDTVPKVFSTIQSLKQGTAIFTQPVGVVKCAGAPQKIMWMALDHWKRAGLYDASNPSASPINISFATGLPVMFGVPKYAATLERLRKERGVEGLFQHDLVEVNSGNVATFALPEGKGTVTKKFDLMHVVPKMGPHAFVKSSALVDATGFIDVDQATTRSKRFGNVWAIGDATNLPTAKTAAAITAQSPVLVGNLLRVMDGKDGGELTYDGYTSCPLITSYDKVLLAEFKYGGQPKETFGKLVDQSEPNRAFFHLKKDFFPWVYQNYMVKGKWGGPKGWISKP
ncbi:hypothetical protein MCOR33_003926 [Pyricularia grisea]|uniref:FAD/NAD(P)-binding domain-containing protein n=1 Tax=Pyricularia grisea TaxID=148305 RepID=A0ABQ8NPU9_PYRGI|nr:hypothetical protein MCOR33_003926 [Pyricularia grisea]